MVFWGLKNASRVRWRYYILFIYCACIIFCQSTWILPLYFLCSFWWETSTFYLIQNFFAKLNTSPLCSDASMFHGIIGNVVFSSIFSCCLVNRPPVVLQNKPGPMVSVSRHRATWSFVGVVMGFFLNCYKKRSYCKQHCWLY